MRVILSFLFCLCSISIAFGQEDSFQKLLDQYNSHSITYISAEELIETQNTQEVVILDAREEKEYKVSHIPSAIYVGFNKYPANEFLLQKLNKNTEIVVYCSVGVRSKKIGEKLKTIGFKNVKNLYGGIFEWKNKGNSVVDSEGNTTEKVHAYSKYWSNWLHSGIPIY